MAPALRPDDVLPGLRALADPTRLQVFGALLGKERCVRDLAATVGHGQPLISHHLRVLSGAGLVHARRADGFTMYAIDPVGMETVRAALLRLLDPDRLERPALAGGNPDCCRP